MKKNPFCRSLSLTDRGARTAPMLTTALAAVDRWVLAGSETNPAGLLSTSCTLSWY